MEENTENQIAGNDPKILRGQIEWALKFTEQGVELIYSPQDDNNNLVALMIAEECARRAKENISIYLKDNPQDKKALDRLGWASKTVAGLKIQIEAFIQMIMHAEQPDIKEQRAELAKSMIAEMEAKIKAGEDVGMTEVANKLNEEIKKADVNSTITVQNPIKDV